MRRLYRPTVLRNSRSAWLNGSLNSRARRSRWRPDHSVFYQRHIDALWSTSSASSLRTPNGHPRLRWQQCACQQAATARVDRAMRGTSALPQIPAHSHMLVSTASMPSTTNEAAAVSHACAAGVLLPTAAATAITRGASTVSVTSAPAPTDIITAARNQKPILQILHDHPSSSVKGPRTQAASAPTGHF